MKQLIAPILADTTSTPTGSPLLVAIVLIVIWTLIRKPSPGSSKQRDMWSGLVALFIGPFGLWIKRRWRDGFKWLGIWLLILGPLALMYMGAPGGYGIVSVALALWILAYIGLVITTVIHTVRAPVGAEPQPPPLPAEVTIAKALDKKETGAS